MNEKELMLNIIDDANKMYLKKIFIIWMSVNVIFFMALIDFWGIDLIARKISLFAPVVSKNFDKHTLIGDVAGRYFGLAVLFIPVAAIFLIWKDQTLIRAKIGIIRAGGIIKYLFLMYFIGMPFFIFILAMMYLSPISFKEDSRLFGEIIIYAMMNNYLGLLVCGGVAILVAVIFFYMILMLILLPFLSIINFKKDY